MIRLQNKISNLYLRIKQLVSVLKESKIKIPKDKSIKKTCVKIGLKTKQRRETSVRSNCVKKMKKKPKLAPKVRAISLATKPVNIPVLTSTKPTFILPNGHLIKIDTAPIIPQPQIIFDVPKILLLPDYKNSKVLIAPKKNDGTVTTSVNKRPIPSLATYNRLLKETNFLKENKVQIVNDTKQNKTTENKKDTKKTQIIEQNINKKKIEENDKSNCLEPVKSNDNKSTSHTIEAIVKDINHDKNEKSIEKEVVTSEIICDGSRNKLKPIETRNISSNDQITHDASICLPTTQTTPTVVNSLSILTEENQRKSMETAKNIMSCFDDIRLPIPNTDFSTDLFSSLQGPVGGHHVDSMSPTEAFLLSFPLVSTSKNTNILNESEQTEMHSATPTTILQIGNLESPATEIFQKNIDDCEKEHNKDKMKDQFGFNEKPYYNNGYIDTNKKNDQMYGYKEVKKLKAIPPPQPTASTYHKTTYNDISSYYKTTQSNSELWRYTSYNNSFDKNLYKNIKKTDKSTSTVFANNVPYVPYDLNATTTTTYIDTENYHEVWPHKPKQKKKQNEKSVPVNWMTDKNFENSYTKKDDYSYQKKNNYDMSYDLQPEPKQTYSWSPSKTIPLLPHLDTNMPSTLPTLVGDLALNINTGSSTPFDQRVYDCNKKNDNIIPVTSSEQNMFNYKSRSINSNFLSVSQLVEQPKSNDKRKGRNCAKDYCCVYQNQKTDKDYYQNQTKQYYPEINTFEQDQSWVRSKYLHDSSRSTNHSAESLIRHQQKNGSIVKSSSKNQNVSNKQTICHRTGQKESYNNNENFGNYYNQHNSNYLYDNRNDLDKQPSTYQIPTNFYTPATTTKHNIANYIPLPTTFSMTSSSYNKPVQHFTQNTNNYYNSSGNVNTLTNFNLSTIFPEMIDKVNLL